MSATLWDKFGINYNGTSMTNGLHIFSKIIGDGTNARREVFRCDGTRAEAFELAVSYFDNIVE